MNIDLFLTEHGQAGLIFDRADKPLPNGVILDAETNFITLEYNEDAETLHLNIPVEDDYKDRLLMTPRVQAATLDNGVITDQADIPLLYLNDPYGGDFKALHAMKKVSRSLVGFEQFMKRCTFAQAVHRADFGDETSAGSVLKGVSPNSLQFAQKLTREIAVEMGPKIAQDLSMGLGGPAPGGPKGPGGLGGSRSQQQVIRKRPPRSDDDSDRQ